MIKKNIQKMSFINPYGKNVKEIKDFIYKIVDELLNRVSNAEKFPPLPKEIKNFDKFNLNDLPISESKILKQIKIIINNSMNASNPYYLGHMDSLPTTMSIVGDIICSTINNNMLSSVNVKGLVSSGDGKYKSRNNQKRWSTIKAEVSVGLGSVDISVD